jgi:transcriptional regulator with XRE-family HTH domain
MDPEHYVTDRERLATALRDLRQAAGMTGVEAARSSLMSQPKISKLETGRLLPSMHDVRALLRLYRASDAQQDELLEITSRLHATIENNRTILRRGAARQQARLGQIEAQSTTIRYFTPIGIPGLLQSAEYMRRVFALRLSGAELARALAARQQRQEILYDPAKSFIFLLTEAALRWRFCPDEVTAAQIGHIASIATLASVEVGVIPTDAHVADIPLHGFEVFDDRLATIGLGHAVVTVTDPRDIATYLRLFATMSQAAEFGQAARARLAMISATLNGSR